MSKIDRSKSCWLMNEAPRWTGICQLKDNFPDIKEQNGYFLLGFIVTLS